MNTRATDHQPVIDVHAHVLIPALQQAVAEGDPEGFAALHALEVRRNGPESMATSGAMIKERWQQLTDLTRRLKDMDAQGVDVQLVSPSPSHFHYFARAELALALAKQANAAVRELIDRAPDRLNGLGLAPLQHPHLMVEALEHAVTECGLAGVEIGSFAGTPGAAERTTVGLSDPRLESFWSRAEELGALVFLHPFGCSLDERLDRFYLANTVSQPAENAVALSHLTFSGVLDRYPELQVLAAHEVHAVGLSDGGTREGFVDDDNCFALSGGRTVQHLLQAGLEETLSIAAETHQTVRPVALRDVQLLAPLLPGTIRDFVAFEEHVEGVRRSIDGVEGVVAEWYEAPTFYFTNPHKVTDTGEVIGLPAGCSELDFETEVAAVVGHVPGSEGKNLSASEAHRPSSVTPFSAIGRRATFKGGR
ncbi:amidohydrolase family protein [Paenarthrobacter sp. 4246]|uniref:amidohydrolase family protein n=1 Tax=Paenarthrobacter sp. 4246 TaxID=3156456 RepID=UPI00339282BB